MLNYDGYIKVLCIGIVIEPLSPSVVSSAKVLGWMGGVYAFSDA